MLTYKTHENQPQSTKAGSQKHAAADKEVAMQLQAENTGLPARLKAGVEHLQANAATVEAPVQAMRQKAPDGPWHVMQQQRRETAPSLSNGQQPVQRVTDELQQPGITTKMQERWNLAYPKMQQLVNTSLFGSSVKHSVLLWAASSGSLPQVKDAYGVTYLYMSNLDSYAGYAQGDHANFSQIIPPYNFSTTPGRAYRIVIVVNLTRNATVEELYTTFLHEWYVHALPWMNDVQAGTDVTDNAATREQEEHKTYANKSDHDLDGYVNSLNLTSGSDKVTTKFREDRDRYSKTTGKLK